MIYLVIYASLHRVSNQLCFWQAKEKFKSTTVPILMTNYGLSERQQIQNPYQIAVNGRWKLMIDIKIVLTASIR